MNFEEQGYDITIKNYDEMMEKGSLKERMNRIINKWLNAKSPKPDKLINMLFGLRDEEGSGHRMVGTSTKKYLVRLMNGNVFWFEGEADGGGEVRTELWRTKGIKTNYGDGREIEKIEEIVCFIPVYESEFCKYCHRSFKEVERLGDMAWCWSCEAGRVSAFFAKEDKRRQEEAKPT